MSGSEKSLTKLFNENVYNAAGFGATIEICLAHSAEVDNTCFECKKSMVFAGAYVAAWHYLGATLTNNNFAHGDLLAVTALYTEILRV
jgi:hypothetical protein